ncbi:hypothetical protein K501DRAFT_292005 [Backusella circina FSU 941]|nr:hypothetical protein K501DRAFT_292005 [Backusella circina FSU 941]
MNINDLLLPTSTETSYNSLITDDQLTSVWEQTLSNANYSFRQSSERSSLTDAILSPFQNLSHETPIHIKVIGRHMNGSFRCHIGTSKASRPIRSTELCDQMRLLAVFFRAESSSRLISPDFIFFPTWLLHLFRYTEYENSPGRTDVRFLENANMAKEDHIYRLNHVLNTLFRFNIHCFSADKLNETIELANFLFDKAGLEHANLPKPIFSLDEQVRHSQPSLYATLLLLLHTPRPSKFKPMCLNCNTKPASRRRLCVACYRYQLKHGEPRPLRLIVANRPGPRVQTAESNEVNPQNGQSHFPMVFYSPKVVSKSQKSCANCGIQETHQWYRNLCGHGHWCETCKSYYLRHTKIRPPELFVKAAKRKVDVRSLVNWSSWSWSDIPAELVEAASARVHDNNYTSKYTSGNVSSSSSVDGGSYVSSPVTPPLTSVGFYTEHNY